MRRPQGVMLLLVLVVGLTSFHAVGQHRVRELGPEYRKWLSEDVRWIMTTAERNEFLALSSDLERAQFVVAFWERRNR
jgi:hypothetical protein